MLSCVEELRLNTKAKWHGRGIIEESLRQLQGILTWQDKNSTSELPFWKQGSVRLLSVKRTISQKRGYLLKVTHLTFKSLIQESTISGQHPGGNA